MPRVGGTGQDTIGNSHGAVGSFATSAWYWLSAVLAIGTTVHLTGPKQVVTSAAVAQSESTEQDWS
jgi:hypothetical protein